SSLHPTSCSDLYTLPLPDALPILVHLTGDPALFARRRAARGAARDTHRPADSPPAAPRVPHIAVDAQLTPEQQRFRVLRELGQRSEEHTSELQSRENLVCRLLLEK